MHFSQGLDNFLLKASTVAPGKLQKCPALESLRLAGGPLINNLLLTPPWESNTEEPVGIGSTKLDDDYHFQSWAVAWNMKLMQDH